MRKFFVFSLPRSRSAWLREFLACESVKVGHDVALRCGSVEEFKAKMEPLAGSCETGAVLGWPLIRALWPGSQFVVVERGVERVARSMSAKGLPVNLPDLEAKQEMLEQVAQLPGTIVVGFESLSSPFACKTVFEACRGVPFDFAWWKQMERKNAQVDVKEALEFARANQARIQAFKQQVLSHVVNLG